MSIKCLLVDDEPLALDVIENHLNKIDNYEIVEKCSDAISAYNVLKNKKIDLIFLDIQMPEMTGLEFLRSLNNPPKVILTTAHREYALDGFDLDVVDYLLKPISFTRFIQAIEKFFISYAANTSEKSQIQQNEEEKFIYIKADKKINKISLDEILYIESMKDYITIFCKSKRITTKQKISEMENELPEDMFIRIHKSFIVSKLHITSFTAYSVNIGSKELTIGRTYKNSVFKAIGYKE